MGARLIAVRHGKPLSEGFADETLRPLSDEGNAVQRRVGYMMKDEKVQPDRIFSSPLIRAVQTAEVLSGVFGVPVIEEDALGYEFDESRLLALINENQTTLFVGHEPTLAEFVNKLVGEDVLPRGLSKSAAAVVDFSDRVDYGTGRLATIFQP